MNSENYPYEDRAREEILRMIPSDGQIIGSIGCGTAATEARLVAQGRQVHGVDISPHAIELASRRITSARLVTPDDRQPFAPGSLDGLILADVIEHLPDARDALAAFTHAVRPGGWVVISVPNMRNIKVLHQFLLRGDWPEHPRGIFDATHLQVMTPRRVERWCAHANLRIEQWYDLYLTHRWKQTLLKSVDAITLRMLHTWWMLSLQLRARKQPPRP